MPLSFTQFLVESAKDKAVVKRVADAINAVADDSFKASLGTKNGSLEPALILTTKDGKMPSKVYDVFKDKRIGIGDKVTTENKDGSFSTAFIVVEM